MVISLLLFRNVEDTSLAFESVCKAWLLLVTALCSRPCRILWMTYTMSLPNDLDLHVLCITSTWTKSTQWDLVMVLLS